MPTDAAYARQLVDDGLATEMREVLGLSRQELARLVGVSPSSIARWEQGRGRPQGDAADRYGRLAHTWLEAAGLVPTA